MREEARALALRALRATSAQLRDEDGTCYLADPVFEGLRRNRVNAETLKAALLLGDDAAAAGFDARVQEGLARRILAGQKAEGCWHEVHPGYDAPSALATSFMAEALLHYAPRAPASLRAPLHESLARAARYVLANERAPGFFQKSEKFLADHLNVDASCGAFLAQYGVAHKDDAALAAAARVAQNLRREQFADGAWPYTTAAGGAPYPHPLHVTCIHYQGVTGYYLAKLHDAHPTPEAEAGLRAGAAWLARQQRPDGRFDWRKSRMMFAYRLSGAYAFAAALFAHAARHEPAYRENARLALRALDPILPGLAWRWEPQRARELPAGAATALRVAWAPGFPLSQKAFRAGHGLYREAARARRSQRLEARLFHVLRRAMRLETTTVEPSKNFPDLFMTAEAIDCLAHVAAEGSR